jgi:hypothetical protein
MPAQCQPQGVLGIHCAIETKQFSLGNSDDVALPDQARRSGVSPGVLAHLMLYDFDLAQCHYSDLPTR